MAALGRKASEAAAAASAAALSNPFTRRVADRVADAIASRGKGGSGDGGGDDDGLVDGGCSGGRSCPDPGGAFQTFGFFDNLCGPLMRPRDRDGGDGPGSGGAHRRRSSSDRRRGRSGGPEPRGRGGSQSAARRPTGSYDYDDETNATDATGSYEEDDDTYNDPPKASRGRDRRPRPLDSPSEMTGYSEFDDETTTQYDAATEASSYDNKAAGSSGHGRPGKGHSSSKRERGRPVDDDTLATKESEKLITQPLASGFAKRCYFTKAGIGRSTQHYEGLTLTGNTVLMLAAAMKLQGCPTICDEDLRRVEQTYPNQFSRLPDELLLSSGWRRISKYCHFSHKPLPDGVPFFHSIKRCHPNGGFYFLLCSAVGMIRLMDVEPLNRDALAVLQTDFPVTADKAPAFLMDDPAEWTLVNKFCFFSGGPINAGEDVYYEAELGGTGIYMLAFLSPSLSPEELYRLHRSGKHDDHNSSHEDEADADAGPLRSVAAVEEVESVYDLTERDFDDLKLYHLGPCRALPPYLLNPGTWTKVLPPRFVKAREEALRIARDWESRFPPAPPPPTAGPGIAAGPSGEAHGLSTEDGQGSSGYVELGGMAGGRPPPSTRSAIPTAASMGPGYHTQSYPGHAGGPHTPMSMPAGGASYFPSPSAGGGLDQAGYPPPHPSHQHPQQHMPYGAPGPYPTQGPPQSPMETELNYYYGASPGTTPGAPGVPPAAVGVASPFPHNNAPHPLNANNPYGNPHPGGPSPERMSAMSAGPMGHGPTFDSGHHQQPYLPHHMMAEPHWRDVQEEGAFSRMGGEQPHDEAIGEMYGGMNISGQGGGMMPSMGPTTAMGPMEPEYEEEYPDRQDPPDEDVQSKSQYQNANDDESESVVSGALMGRAQTRLKEKRMNQMKEKRSQRPNLSTMLDGDKKNAGNNKHATPGTAADDSTWDTRTDGESSYGTSLVSGSSYTDTTNPGERNSRRALILQMAKARMKNVKEQSTVDKNAGAQTQETSTGMAVDAAIHNDMGDEVAGLELD